MGVFYVHLKDIVSNEDRPYFNNNGIGTVAGKVVNLLESYFKPAVEKSKLFDSVAVRWSPDNYAPVLSVTDVIVYVVPDIHKSVIAANGGTIAIAEANTNILGLTDLNARICEVYFDRTYQYSAKELAGAAYHEIAHIKADLDDFLHNGQNGFLGAAPDYNGSPSTKNTDTMANHLGRQVNMRSGL